jgi:hypothetical protein
MSSVVAVVEAKEKHKNKRGGPKHAATSLVPTSTQHISDSNIDTHTSHIRRATPQRFLAASTSANRTLLIL